MRRAFTGFELLVVLVICLVLSLMLLPVLDQSRDAAVNTKCMGRVRQVGIAMAMYQTAHDGFWPTARRSPQPDDPLRPDGTASLAALYPGYAPKPYLFQCPATDDLVVLEPDGRDFLDCDNFFVSPKGRALRDEAEGQRPPRPPSYFYDGGSPNRHRIPRESVPARVVYGDECVHGSWQTPAGEHVWVGENNHPRGGGNFLFADKRVEWLAVEWTGEPWLRGESEPYVPNKNLRTVPDPAGVGPDRPMVAMDRNVFTDDWLGKRPREDADLVGMMWVAGGWEEQ